MEDLHRELDRASTSVKDTFGAIDSMYIGGMAVVANTQFEDRSPIDTRIVLGRFQSGTSSDVDSAVRAARDAFSGWARRRWEDRISILRALGRTIHARRIELSALMGYESGKSRIECLGDVGESADLIEYYCAQFDAHHGFIRRMDALSAHEENLSLLRPYGVWSVIAPSTSLLRWPPALWAQRSCPARPAVHARAEQGESQIGYGLRATGCGPQDVMDCRLPEAPEVCSP